VGKKELPGDAFKLGYLQRSLKGIHRRHEAYKKLAMKGDMKQKKGKD